MFWGKNRWSQPEKIGLERKQKKGNKWERERQRAVRMPYSVRCRM